MSTIDSKKTKIKLPEEHLRLLDWRYHANNNKKITDIEELLISMIANCSKYNTNYLINACNSLRKVLYIHKKFDSGCYLRPLFNKLVGELKKHITPCAKKLGVKISCKIILREKSIESSLDKILRLIIEGRSLEWFRDNSNDSKISNRSKDDIIILCYHLMYDVIIPFMAKNDFSVCDAEELPQNIFPRDIFTTRTDKALKKYETTIFHQKNVKSYITNPKSNNYRSLQAVFKSSIGTEIEVQILTHQFNSDNEHGKANRKDYKRNQKNIINKKASNADSNYYIMDYTEYPDGSFEDDCGLIEPKTHYFRKFTIKP